MTIRIVTDSTCDLPESVVQECGITIIPLYVNFGARSYLDGVELSRREFYEMLPESDTFPTTAMPGPPEPSQTPHHPLWGNRARGTDHPAKVYAYSLRPDRRPVPDHRSRLRPSTGVRMVHAPDARRSAGRTAGARHRRSVARLLPRQRWAGARSLQLAIRYLPWRITLGPRSSSLRRRGDLREPRGVGQRAHLGASPCGRGVLQRGGTVGGPADWV